MIAVIAAVRGQIESNRHPLLPRRKIATVKSVRFLCRGKTGILPDGPGAASIHRGLDATSKGGLPRDAIQMRKIGHILLGIERLHRDPLERVPRQILGGTPPQFLGRELTPIVFLRCHSDVLFQSDQWADVSLPHPVRFHLIVAPNHPRRQTARTDRRHRPLAGPIVVPDQRAANALRPRAVVSRRHRAPPLHDAKPLGPVHG